MRKWMVFIGSKYHTAANVERFWSHVAIDMHDTDACFPWTGYRSHGYGRFYVTSRKSFPAHRMAYELATGAIPDGLVIDHLCRNPACVNPAHLDPVKHRENILRGVGQLADRARQTVCKHGHPLTGDNVKVRKEGWRQCRECNRRIAREGSVKRRAARRAIGLCLWCPSRSLAGRSVCQRHASERLAKDRLKALADKAKETA